MAVCCLDEPGAWSDELRQKGISVDALGRVPGFHPSLAGRLAEVAARHGANVIHAHQYSPFVYSALAKLWRPAIKVVFTEHGRLSDAPPSAKRRLANRLLSRLPFEAYAVSAELKQYIVQEGFPGSGVGVIYNGIDIGPLPTAQERARTRAALGLKGDTLVIGTVARLDPVKDLGTLVVATAQVNQRCPATLLVIGDGDERASLEQIAKAVDGGRSTRFLGHRDDARKLLAACDVYANSSTSEGVSLTILEAMAAGLPVVATRVGGTAEVVDQTCAVLVPARSPESLGEALRSLADAPDRRRSLGAAGRARVEARFTLDRMIREYNDVYWRAATA